MLNRKGILCGSKNKVSFSGNQPSTLPKAVQQPPQAQQWQKAATINPSHTEISRKSVKFANEPQGADHFTKPSYLNQNPPQMQHNQPQMAPMASNSMPRSRSLTNLPEGGPKNTIPVRAPSNSGFKPSFITSEPPDSAKSATRYHDQAPASYPSGYSDKGKLGASAAAITELLKKSSQPGAHDYNLDGDVKIQRTESSSSKKRVKFKANLEENKSLHIEGEDDGISSSRKEKQSELQRILQNQIQEKIERQKREEELLKKQDELEEERIKKEMEEEARRYQMEKEMEAKKIEDAKRENEQLIQQKQERNNPPPVQKRVRVQEPEPEQRQPDYSVYDQANKDYSTNSFAPGQAPPDYQPPGVINREKQYENNVFERGDPAQKYHRLPNWPMRNHDAIHKENLIGELQKMLKQNLQVEAEKLKEEFQFNQKEFTDQVDKLKKETQKAVLQRNAARKELGRLQNELDYKRDYDEDYSKNLMVALTRYNPANMYRPPQEDPNSVPMVGPFRGAGIQKTRLDSANRRLSYEKIFFQDDGKKVREIQSHRGEKTAKSTAELFGVPSKYLPGRKKNLEVDSQMISLKDEQRSKKIDIPTKTLKQAQSLDPMNFPTVKKKKDDDRLDEEIPPNFVYHLEDQKPGDLLPDIRKIEKGQSIAMPNGALGVAGTHSIKEDRMGITAKMGGELPSLPEYNGLLNGNSTISKLMKNYIGKHTGENEFKEINRKNDLMLQKLVDDKPEERYRTKPHVYVDPKDDIKFDSTFQGDDTFNDRSTVNYQLPSSSNQNFDVVNQWESTLGKLKDGNGAKDGIREAEYPLKPVPFDALH